MTRVLAPLLTLLAISNAAASVLTVDCAGGGDFETIGEAVAAAVIGDTLLISPCTYVESVDASELGLTFVGSGADVTRLEWSGAEAALLLVQTDVVETTLGGMAVANTGAGPAIEWSSYLSLEACDVQGLIRGDLYLVTVPTPVVLDASNCGFADVDLRGGGYSALTDCQLENLWIVGSCGYMNVYSPHMSLDNCQGDSVAVGSCGVLAVNGGEYGPVTLYGGLHAWPVLDCEAATLGPVEVIDTPDRVDLTSCHLGPLRFVTDEYMYFPEGFFRVNDCTIAGSVELGGEQLWAEFDGNTILGTFSCMPDHWWGGWFRHNTVTGDFECTAQSWWDGRLRSNIVVGETSVDVANENIVVSHNDCVGGLFVSVEGDSVFGNLSADPLFCSASGGDYTLEECSPCVGAAHDGGDIGAHGWGCACSVPVELTTWGRLKAAYR